MKRSDGRAALRCWPVDVDVAGRSYRILGRPAIDWILKVADARWLAIVPGMVDGDEIDDRIDQGLIHPRALVAAGQSAVSTATGMQWWSACRIANAVVSDVELAGALVLAGVDAERVSIGGFVAAAYRLMMADRDKKQRASLDSEITRVPKGVRTDDLYDPNSAAAGFELAFARQRTTQ